MRGLRWWARAGALVGLVAGTLVVATASPSRAALPPPGTSAIVSLTTSGGAASGVGSLDGQQPMGMAGGASMSADGRYVVFASINDTLSGYAGNQHREQVYRRDLQTGVTTLVSIGTDALPSNTGSFAPVISGDGSTVAFVSRSTNLVSTTLPPGSFQVFVRKLNGTPTTSLASVDNAGNAAVGPSQYQSLSYDGNRVVFQSSEGLVDSGHGDIYYRDLGPTPQTVSVDKDTLSYFTGPFNSWGAKPSNQAISADGRYITFMSRTYAPGGNACEPLAQAPSAYLFDVSNPTSIIRLLTWSDIGCNSDNDGRTSLPHVSPDGSVVAIVDSTHKIRVYSTATGSLAQTVTINAGVTGIIGDPAVSNQGARMVFTTLDAAVGGAGDTNGRTDVFRIDRGNTSAQPVSVTPSGGFPATYQVNGVDGDYAISPTTGATTPSVTPDGRNASFSAWASDLVAGDANGSPDMFARGLPAVAPVEAPSAFLNGGPLPWWLMHSSSVGCPSCKDADPVQVPSGEFWHTFSDFSIPGRGVALDLTRTYSAFRAPTDGPFGFGWTMSYGGSIQDDAVDGIITVKEEDGSEVSFDHTTLAPINPTTKAAAPYVQATLTHDTTAHRWYFVRRNQLARAFDDTTGLPVTLYDRNGSATTLSYVGGRLSQVTDPAGRSLIFHWDANGHVDYVTDPASRRIDYGYNAAGELTSVTPVINPNPVIDAPNSGKWTFTYAADGSHRLATMLDPNQQALAPANQHPITNIYDTLGRVSSQTDALQRTTTWDYAGPNGAIITTDPKGNKVARYFSQGLPTKITYGYGTTDAADWLYEYDANEGMPSKVTDPNLHYTTYAYDSAGNRTSMQDQVHPAWTAQYNTFNEPTTVTAAGVTTTYTYDPPIGGNPGVLSTQGNLRSISTPVTVNGTVQNQVTTYRYEDAAHPGDLTSTSDPNHLYVNGSSPQTKYQYDANGYRNQMLDPMSNKTTWTYDVLGRPLTMVTPRGYVSPNTPAMFTTTFDSYTTFGQLLQSTAPPSGSVTHVTKTTYDANHNRVGSTDADNNATGYAYDAADQLVMIDRPGSADLRNAYFADGSLQYQEDGNGKRTTYGYNARGQLTSVTDPLSRTTTFTVDGAGNIRTKQAPANCNGNPLASCATTYRYDAANQLDTDGTNPAVDYGDGTTPDITDLTYDSAGRRTAATLATGQASSWSYDELGRLVTSNDGTGAVTYAYDLAGVRTSMAYPGGSCTGTVSKCVTYGKDNDNRVTSATSSADWNGGATVSFGYDENGNLKQTTYPGITDTYAFDPVDAMSSVTLGALGSQTYTRDGNSQLTKNVQTGLTGNGTTHYGYSCLNQLKWSMTSTPGSNSCSSPPAGAAVYGYDNADNLTQKPGGSTQSFDVANEITQSGTTTYGFDTRGNRTSMTPSGAAATAFGYDLADRLSSYAPPAVAGNDGEYTPLTEARIMDTRGSSYPNCGGPCAHFTGSNTDVLTVTGHDGVPAAGTVDSVVVTLTATGATSAGYVTVWADGTSMPNTSTLNFGVGQTITNTAVVKVSAAGKIDVKAFANVDVIVDVQGYYSSPTGGAGSEFTAMNPVRLVDTRVPTGPCGAGGTSTCTSVPANGDLIVKVTGVGGVTATATSVAANLTAINPTGSGSLSIVPNGTSPTTATNLTYAANQVVAGFSVVKPNGAGEIKIHNWAAVAVPLTIDLEGYSIPSSSGSGASYVEAAPSARLVDTRTPSSPCTSNPCGALNAGQTSTIQVVNGKNTDGSLSAVPGGARAVVVNITAIPGSCPSSCWMTAYAGDQTSVPTSSTLNYTAAPIANTAIVRLSGDGKIQLNNAGGSSVHYAVDVLGWYTSAWSYTYNADGLRLSKSAPDATKTSFAWDKSGGLSLLLTETTGSATTSYLYGPDGSPYAQIVGGTTTYLHHDQIGSTVLGTNSSGASVGSAAYEPYGALAAGSAVSKLGYAGQYTDPESGLQYLRARYYEPSTGQFLTRDPVVEMTRDAYGYAARNPLANTDPRGLQPIPVRYSDTGWRDVDDVGSGAQLYGPVLGYIGPSWQHEGGQVRTVVLMSYDDETGEFTLRVINYERSSYEVGIGFGAGIFGFTPPSLQIEMHDDLGGMESSLCFDRSGKLISSSLSFSPSIPSWAIDKYLEEWRRRGAAHN